jgi:hypothetical protein
MSQENEPKKVYTVIATITEVEKDGNVHIKGAGKYIYEKDDKIKWLILEGASAETSKFLAETKDFVVDVKDDIQRAVLATAMINKKAVKLTIEENTSFSITSIKNP